MAVSNDGIKRYAGDGVYWAVSAWGDIKLTTENGIRTTNCIVLEPEVLASILRQLNPLFLRSCIGDIDPAPEDEASDG